TVFPRSRGTFLTSRSAIDTNGTAVSRMRSMISGGIPSSVSRCCSSPPALSCGLRTWLTCRGLDREPEPVCAAIEHHRQLARHRHAGPDVGSLDRQLAPTAVDQNRELDLLRAAVVEQLVDRGADRAAGEKDVVDQDDAASLDVERQL